MWSKKNPLDPHAFDTEADPFIIQGMPTHAAMHVGVHTANTYDRAMVYAVQRAMLDGTLAVVFHVDVSGLTPLPDRDAMLKASEDVGYLFDAMDGLLDATDVDDTDTATELLEEYQEKAEPYSSDDGVPTTWVEGATQALETASNDGLIAALLDLDGDQLTLALKSLRDRGALPAAVWMEVVGQQRYMVPIGLDRIVQVDLIRPLRDELWTYEEMQEEDIYPPDDPSIPEIFCPEMFYEDQACPDIHTVYTRPGSRRQVEYHGTDIVRALLAFPELKDVLVNPWPYAQPQLEEPTGDLFSLPQCFVEAEARSQRNVGIYPMAKTTGRLLLGQRSWAVLEPGQWAGFGGAIALREDPQKGALRELEEETGYHGKATLIEFAPNLFLAEVPEEFAPRLNWETDQAGWFNPAKISDLEPRHWGLGYLVAHLLRYA